MVRMIVRAGACVHGWCMCARRRDCLSTQRERNISHSFANRNYPNCATIPTAQRHCVVSHVSFRFVINYSSPALILPFLIPSFTSRCPAATHAGQHTLRLVRLTKDVIDHLRRATPQHHQFHRFLTGCSPGQSSSQQSASTWSHRCRSNRAVYPPSPWLLLPSQVSAHHPAVEKTGHASRHDATDTRSLSVKLRQEKKTIATKSNARSERNQQRRLTPQHTLPRRNKDEMK